MATCGLVLFLCLASFLIDFSAAIDCTKVPGQVCQAKCNGKKYDLKDVTKSDKNITDGVYYYVINFCEAVDCGQNANVAICQGKTTGGRVFSLGTIDSAVWNTSDSSGDFNVTISGNSQGEGTFRITVITFTPGSKSSITFNNEVQGVNQITYYFTATYSSGGNIAGPIGWVLISLALIGLIIYFIAGILFMYFVKGARGLEVIPNVNFWKSLPLLIVEGCLFVISPCRKKFGKNEYEKI